MLNSICFKSGINQDLKNIVALNNRGLSIPVNSCYNTGLSSEACIALRNNIKFTSNLSGLKGKINFNPVLKKFDTNINNHFELFSKVTEMPDFIALSVSGKEICSKAVLFNEIIKNNENLHKIIKYGEDLYCNKLPDELVDALTITPKIRTRVINLVKNSDWIKLLINRSDPEKALDFKFFNDTSIVKEIAFNFRRPEDLKIAKIISSTSGQYKPVFDGHIKTIEEFLNNVVYSNGIWLPTTKIPKASEINMLPVVIGNGSNQTKNIIIKLNKDTDFEKLGFEKGTTYENLRMLIHAVPDGEFDKPELINLKTVEGQDYLLSGSYITGEHNSTIARRNSGVILKPDPSNIVAAANHNLCSNGSYGAKNLKDFQRMLLSSGIVRNSRDNFAETFKKIGNYSHEEYVEIFKKLTFVDYLDEIDDSKLKETINKTIDDTLINHKSLGNNEVIVHGPEKIATFSKEQYPENISYGQRIFSEKYDLPILMI